jgi:hypothetical protein
LRNNLKCYSFYSFFARKPRVHFEEQEKIHSQSVATPSQKTLEQAIKTSMDSADAPQLKRSVINPNGSAPEKLLPAIDVDTVDINTPCASTGYFPKTTSSFWF